MLKTTGEYNYDLNLNDDDDVEDDDELNDENEKKKTNFKHDIYIKESIRRASSTSRKSSLRLSRKFSQRSSCSLYSPKSCPICLEPYKVGDDIAWSKNEACVHAFHLDCIMDWLMMGHDDCPLCRQDYLFVGDNNV